MTDPSAVAFGNEVALTDDTAFGNEIARMISLCSIIESNSYLRSPKINNSIVYFGYPDWGNSYLRFSPQQTDRVLVYYGVDRPSAVAFGNEVARTISLCSIVESNSSLRFPHSKQINPGLLWGGVVSDETLKQRSGETSISDA